MGYLSLILVVLLGYFLLNRLHLSDKCFKLLLTFSGAFLLSQIVLEILPEIYVNNPNPIRVGLFIMLGVLLQVFLDFFSKGLEHGHRHKGHDSFSIMIFISLSIHSILEGFPLADNPLLVYGILIHKLPVAMVLTMILIRSSINRLMGMLLMLLFALATPFGMLISKYFIPGTTVHIDLMALVVGVLLHVSTVILLESMEEHKFNLQRLVAIILGMSTAILISY